MDITILTMQPLWPVLSEALLGEGSIFHLKHELLKQSVMMAPLDFITVMHMIMVLVGAVSWSQL